MCFNISIAKEKKTLEKRFKAKFQEGIKFEPNYFLSAFAKPYVPVITNNKPNEIQLFKWGLIPHWVRTEEQAKDLSTKTFNARVETAKEKPSFRDAMKSKHCLVLANGFFEWKTEGKNKIPHYIYQEEMQPFAFAGIWNEWVNKESGEIHNTFSILTQDANPFMANIHNTKKRQPIILTEGVEQDWLNSGVDSSSFEQIGFENQLQAHIIDRSFRTMGNSIEVINPI